ncbi:MAG: CHAD domain-containing protein [Hyphomicrobiaceae bacterium]
MAYVLQPGQPLDEAVRAVLLEEAQKARKRLAREDRTEAVHAARKSFKRARALVGLAAPALAPRAARHLDRAYRDLGRRLSAQRDADVMRATALQVRQDLSASARRVLDACVDKVAAAEAVTNGAGRAADVATDLSRCRKDLANLRDDIATMDLDGLRGERGLAAVGTGLEAVYRTGRRALCDLYASGVPALSDEAFHDWRKVIQRHWRHCELLQGAWPEMMSARVNAARTLSQMIGEDHDLSVLAARLTEERRSYSASRSTDEIIAVCRRGQLDLRRRAYPIATRLYAFKPSSLAVAVMACWRGSGPLSHVTAGDDGGSDGPGEPKRQKQTSAEIIRFVRGD